MYFTWQDYDPEKMGYIEGWLDKDTAYFTGLDEGFQSFYEYCAAEHSVYNQIFPFTSAKYFAIL